MNGRSAEDHVTRAADLQGATAGAGEIRLEDAPMPPPGYLEAGTAPRRDRRSFPRRVLGMGLAASDLIALVAALLLADLFEPFAATGGYHALPLLAVPLWLGVFHAFGLYAPLHLAPYDEFRRLIAATSLGTVLIVCAAAWSESSVAPRWIVVTLALALFFELTSRRVWRWAISRLKLRGIFTLRTAIVGTDGAAAKLAYALEGDGLGFEPIGFVAVDGPLTSPNGLPVLGYSHSLEQTIEQHDLDCVFVSTRDVDAHKMNGIVQAARRGGAEVRLMANMYSVLESRLFVQSTGGILSLALRPVRLNGPQAFLKRMFDVVIALTVLILALPAMTLVAAAIAATSRGRVIFSQKRVTTGNRPFKMYKFRTMVADGDKLLRERGIDPSRAFFKVDDDPRITKVGKILRRTSLDELPQLWNVVKGDMSLVGPRPLPVDQVSANHSLLTPRHEVRTGVTGWWQINGRSQVDPEGAVRMDLFYIENWSLSLDLYILAKTLGAVIIQRGAI
ncbi:MAG: sugar transferase [Actinomycetota bacterium]